MKNILKRLFQLIQVSMSTLASIALVLMMLVVVVDIIGRTFGLWFVLSTVEQTILYMIILGFFGLASCFRDEGNIVVDIATQKLSLQSVRRIDAFWAFVAAIVLPALAYLTFKDGLVLHGFGRRSEVLQISPLVHHTIAAVGLLMAALISIAESVRLLLRRDQPDSN